MTTRPFRFGVILGQAPSRAAWVEKARRVEDDGFDTLFVSDHFWPSWAPFATLGTAAAVTKRVRLGTSVLDNDFRHPAVVAKEMATLDVLSEGRVEVGLGAGWTLADYEQTGIPFDEGTVRVDRLEEGARVMRGLFGPEPFSFAGTYYKIAGLDGTPKPVQSRVPILIGGSRRRILSAAARVADIIGVHVGLDGRREKPPAGLLSSATEERIGWIRSAAGSRFPEIELLAQIYVLAVDRPAAEVAAECEKLGLPPEHAGDSIHVLAGSVDGIVEQLHERRERFGISYFSANERNAAALVAIMGRAR